MSAVPQYPLPGAQRTTAQVEEALRQSGGVLTAASEMLKVSRTTLYSYIDGCKYLQAVRKEVDEVTLDIAEGQLIKLVTKGDREAIKYFLRCKGKARGWRETVEVTGANGGPIDVRDVSKLSNEQLEAIVRGEARTE